ncbi:D-fructose-6-phosphate amidotransferase [Phaeocystis globosa virus 12T]|uniref:Glucosamine-fructose-6-phosphate aminotransferase n=1 Tax=Phaeocystis globosa virus PgV-16T TaxID=3071227 RepID=A0AC59EWT6_9VIRU|nr:glucosamine-fructose-6-phosphate aminotransferase [Phaeocystis globosa virus]AET72960.1 D-fructose-6-phosphate amidotransferase [Phaeocystis globosa virus 12T]AET73778.1 D-fructose-6-phosphate amidotransferase [Phaeocystis globosa virus 14T]AGM15422.1 glucosamine-fructose-6-phosphate aminotransferase [Phaeocystis globosa virus PgV-16T]UYE94152.1 glucosamine-fructose-6-phosphate aminotransferase [Phaeocystis globosa virus]
MCGIVLILSKTKDCVMSNILKSLKLIQNRGYDSMGICYYDEITNEYKIKKHASNNVSDCYNILSSSIVSNKIESHIAFGHTRWATHGEKSDLNAHPHTSKYGNIILVHNGIINNFMEIKLKLINNGFTFYSGTDTEVIANLIEYYLLNEGNTIEKAIQNATTELRGTWALVITYTKEAGSYYITKKGSPLIMGSNEKHTICTSETSGFANLMTKYIVVDDDDIIKITNEKYESIIEPNHYYSIKNVYDDEIIDTCEPYNHWMIKEIMEQQETILKAYGHGSRIDGYNVRLGGLSQIFEKSQNIEYILLIGCGTSYNAGLMGEIYFNSNNKFISIKCIDACDFSSKAIPKINKSKVLCIFLTQSGETVDVYKCLSVCKSVGCNTMGIINKRDSLIARDVDCGVYLNAGVEVSVASTKSFTSMIVVLSLVEMWFNTDVYANYKKMNSLRFVSNTLTQLLYNYQILKSIDDLVGVIYKQNINNIFILGKGKLYPIAREASLKIKEVSYIHSESFSAGSLKHGPLALLDNTNLTILMIDYDDYKSYENLKSTYYEITARKTNIFVITNSIEVTTQLNIDNGKFLLIPREDYYNEILFIVTLQYMAYQLAVIKGLDPDKPRNLAKVVTVE